MNRLLGSVIVALAVLAGDARAAEADPLLPDAAEMVLTIKVRELADAPFFRTYGQDLAKALLTNPDSWGRLFPALGIDPLAHVRELVLAGPASLAGNKFLIVLRGSFDMKRIEAAAAAWAKKYPGTVTVHKESNHVVYEFPSATVPVRACLLDNATLIVARSRDYLDEAIAKKDGKQKPAPGKELLALLGRIDARQTLWLAALASPGLKKELATAPETDKLFANLLHLQGGITVASDCRIALEVQTRDARTAGELRPFAEGIKAILSLAAMDHKTHAPLLTTLVAGLQIGSSKEVLILGGKVTPEQVDKALRDKAKP
jgi:hypothetical protein